MATFPVTLPAPIVGEYSETPPDTLIRTKMDAGIAKVRRRFSAGSRMIKYSMVLTPAQLDALDTFVVTTTNGGADEFDYTHPRTGAAVKARFMSMPSYQDIDGRNHRASVEIEIIP